MRIHKRWFWAAAAVLGLVASLSWENRAAAQETETLVLNGGYPSFYYSLQGFNGGAVMDAGSGSIGGASLGGAALAYVYCIDIPDTVPIPGTYTTNNINTNGQAVVGDKSVNTWANGTNLASVPNAGAIASLLTQFGTSATTATEQEALQSAIWTEIYGSKFQVYNFLGAQQGIVDQMNYYLSHAGTAPASSVLWLSPGGYSTTGANIPIYQALVAQYVAPEPSSLAIAGLGALAFMGYGLRRRKALGA
jgi:PEP-CTERM motif